DHGPRQRDPAMVALALLGALVLLAIPLIAWVDDEVTLLLVILVLILAAGLGVRSLGALLPAHASPWFVTLFRMVAMGLTAGLMIVLLAVLFEPEMEARWAWGIALAAMGLLLIRARQHPLLREAGFTLVVAGLLLACAGVYALDGLWPLLRVAGLLLFGLALYVYADNAAVRLLVA